MAQHYLFGVLMVLTCFSLEASSRPSSNEYFGRNPGGWGRREFKKNNGFNWRSNAYRYNGISFMKKSSKLEDFTLFIKPVAHAMSGDGVAIANPISHVIIAKDKTGSVLHTPVASAVVGPGGIAHAQSDLYIYEGQFQYLPFYGGAKGHYLEVKKDNKGIIISEKILTEENISSDNILKHKSEETVISKVLATNLHDLKDQAKDVYKAHNKARKLGCLEKDDKDKMKHLLANLAETASNTIKLIEEIGDDYNVLYKCSDKECTDKEEEEEKEKEKQTTKDDEDVGEEGVGIESYEESGIPSEILGGAIVAEAKPVGLAVIGENGLASSRPLATAVASSGVAIARPIGTAIAGIDPTLLGINFQINKS